MFPVPEIKDNSTKCTLFQEFQNGRFLNQVIKFSLSVTNIKSNSRRHLLFLIFKVQYGGQFYFPSFLSELGESRHKTGSQP